MEEVASTDTPSFLLHLSESLDDEHIITKFQKIMKPVMEPVMEALNVANSQIACPQEQLDKKDEAISAVQDRVTDLEILGGTARMQRVDECLWLSWCEGALTL